MQAHVRQKSNPNYLSRPGGKPTALYQWTTQDLDTTLLVSCTGLSSSNWCWSDPIPDLVYHLDAYPDVDPDFYLMRMRIRIRIHRSRLPKWCGSGCTTLLLGLVTLSPSPPRSSCCAAAGPWIWLPLPRIWCWVRHPHPHLLLRPLLNKIKIVGICNSVADPGFLSRIPIFTHPGSRIPDPKTAMKDRGEKIFVVLPFFWSHKYHKIEVFNFWNGEEKNLGQFSTNYRTFYPKLSLS